MTSDVASAEFGGQVSVASSFDERFLPSNMIDGDPKSFWVTTGLYPQEFVVELDRPYDIACVKLVMSGVKSLVIEKSEAEDPSTFQMVTGPVKLGSDASASRTEITEKEIKLSGTRARHVKFIIQEGWSDFCAVYKVGLEGSPLG